MMLRMMVCYERLETMRADDGQPSRLSLTTQAGQPAQQCVKEMRDFGTLRSSIDFMSHILLCLGYLC